MIGNIFGSFPMIEKKFTRDGSGRDFSLKGHKKHKGKDAEGKREEKLTRRRREAETQRLHEAEKNLLQAPNRARF